MPVAPLPPLVLAGRRARLRGPAWGTEAAFRGLQARLLPGAALEEGQELRLSWGYRLELAMGACPPGMPACTQPTRRAAPLPGAGAPRAPPPPAHCGGVRMQLPGRRRSAAPRTRSRGAAARRHEGAERAGRLRVRACPLREGSVPGRALWMCVRARASPKQLFPCSPPIAEQPRGAGPWLAAAPVMSASLES